MNRIEGESVELRELPVEDAKRLLAGERETHWSPEYPGDGTKVAAGILVIAFEEGRWRPGFGMYQIVRSADGMVVGDIGFHGPPNADGVVEIGYELIPLARGVGLATDAVQTLVVWAMGRKGVTGVEAETSIANAASQAVLKRSGFEVVATDGDNIRFRCRLWPHC